VPNLQKGKTRLQVKAEAKPLTTITEKAFKTTVWTRDRKRCRCCGRKVQKTMARVPERGEVHHLHGRGGELRFEAKAAVLVCLTCHEKLTGRVSEKWTATGTRFFEVRDKSGVHDCIDARFPIHFLRAA
jgi:hypothetical protein